MTIDEAIEILGDIIRFVKPADPPYEHDALKLGIEALRRIQKLRGYSMTQVDTKLSGETEE